VRVPITRSPTSQNSTPKVGPLTGCIMLSVLLSAVAITCGGALYACPLTAPGVAALLVKVGHETQVDLSGGYQGELDGITLYDGDEMSINLTQHAHALTGQLQLVDDHDVTTNFTLTGTSTPTVYFNDLGTVTPDTPIHVSFVAVSTDHRIQLSFIGQYDTTHGELSGIFVTAQGDHGTWYAEIIAEDIGD
jgi:hypothetical protein